MSRFLNTNVRPCLSIRGSGIVHDQALDRLDANGKVSLRRAGRMHHIGIGRAHNGQRVVLLIADLDIRVINHDTGDYCGSSSSTRVAATNPASNERRPSPSRGFGRFRCPETSHGGRGGT